MTTRAPDPATVPTEPASLGEAAAIGRIEKALFGGEDRLVRLGRYEIVDSLGSGAFGKVYRANDPQLARHVALKVLELDAAPGDAHAHDDLLAEARVMATVADPNVAAVYDAGVVDGAPPRVFIAMELVDGASLRGWLARSPRSVAAVLDVVRQAARGLAAAHAAGVVHRDFKPENILVGTDGRVRVVDFGLARSVGTVAPADTEPLDMTVTATGAIAGTPAYMAPELLAGADATPASDQFACCVTAWEALFGGRPFAGKTLAELRAAVLAPPVVPRRRGVPRAIANALVRGLARDPGARFPGMADLVAALAPRRPRWVVAAGIAAVVAFAIAIGVVVARRAGAPAADPCPRATAELAGVWDAERRAAVEAAFAATGVPHAKPTFARIAPALDRAATAWVDAHRAACVATHVRHDQSAELLDRRVACLDRWRRQLASVTTSLARATPAVVDHASRAIGDLPPLQRCASRDELAAGPAPPPPAIAAQVAALQDQLGAARVQYFLGDPAAALAAVEAVERDGAAAAYTPVQAEAFLWHGEVLIQLGRYDEARAIARQAFDTALQIRDHRTAALAASTLAFTGAFDSSLAQESLQWVATGNSLRTQLEAGDDVEAKLAHVEGNVYLTAADPARARAPLERALAAWRRIMPEHPNAATTLAMLGVSVLQLGDAGAAREHLREAARLCERDLGPEHHELAASLVNLGLAEAALGAYGEAGRAMDRGIAIQTRALGASHPLVGYARLNRAQVATAHGDREVADRELAAALDIATRAYGADHAVTVTIRLASAEHAARGGRGGAAVAHAKQVLAAADADEDHVPRALGEATLALGLTASGDRRGAAAHARAALAHLGRAQAATPSQRAIVHGLAGEVLGDAALLEQAQTELAGGPPDPYRLTFIRFALARATGKRELVADVPAEIDPALRARIATWAARSQ